jgi:hypothetical protein
MPQRGIPHLRLCPANRTRRTQVWRVALVGLVTLGVAPSCASSGASEVKGTRVAVVGDSLTATGEFRITEQFKQAGWKTSVSAFLGVTTQEQMPVLAKVAKSQRDAYVVELGTNDVRQLLHGTTTVAAEETQLGQALDLFGSDCVVWVNVDSDPSRPGGFGGGAFNALLAKEATERSNLHIADLNAVLAAHFEYFRPDQIHLTDAGYVALGALMALTAQQCR